jgi:hypothetical protein
LATSEPWTHRPRGHGTCWNQKASLSPRALLKKIRSPLVLQSDQPPVGPQLPADGKEEPSAGFRREQSLSPCITKCALDWEATNPPTRSLQLRQQPPRHRYQDSGGCHNGTAKQFSTCSKQTKLQQPTGPSAWLPDSDPTGRHRPGPLAQAPPRGALASGLPVPRNGGRGSRVHLTTRRQSPVGTLFDKDLDSSFLRKSVARWRARNVVPNQNDLPITPLPNSPRVAIADRRLCLSGQKPSCPSANTGSESQFSCQARLIRVSLCMYACLACLTGVAFTWFMPPAFLVCTPSKDVRSPPKTGKAG